MAASVPKMPGMASKPVYLESWFELVLVTGCMAAGWLLCEHVRTPASLNPETIQTVAMAKLMAEGQWLDALTRFNQPPVYPAMLAGAIKFLNTTRLPELIHGFQQLNAGLYLVSILLVHGVAKRLIRKPYSLLVSVLYTLAPPTLWMAWSVGPHMAFVVFSMASLWMVDRVFSKKLMLPIAMGAPITRGDLVGCAALISLALLTHQAGYFLLGAFFLVCLKKFGLRKSAMVLLATVLCISPFIGRDIAYGVREFRTLTRPMQAVTDSIHRDGWLKTAQVYGEYMLKETAHQAVGVMHLSAVSGNAPTVETERVPWVPIVLGVLLLVGLGYGLSAASGISSLYVIAYGFSVLVLLPPDGRLVLAPVLPLLLLYLYYGIMRSGEWFKTVHLPVSRILGPVLTVWILLCTATTLLSQNGFNPHHHAMGETGEPAPGNVYAISTAKPPQNRLQKAQLETSRKRALDWLSSHAPKSAKVAIPRPAAASRLADHKGGDWIPDQLRSELTRYDYLVEEGSTRFIPNGTETAENGMLKLVYEDAPGKIRIWQIQPLN